MVDLSWRFGRNASTKIKKNVSKKRPNVKSGLLDSQGYPTLGSVWFRLTPGIHALHSRGRGGPVRRSRAACAVLPARRSAAAWNPVLIHRKQTAPQPANPAGPPSFRRKHPSSAAAWDRPGALSMMCSGTVSKWRKPAPPGAFGARRRPQQSRQFNLGPHNSRPLKQR